MTALSFVWVHPYSQNSRCDNIFYTFLLSYCFVQIFLCQFSKEKTFYAILSHKLKFISGWLRFQNDTSQFNSDG